VALITVIVSGPALAEDTNGMSTLAGHKKIYESILEQIERKSAVDMARIKRGYPKAILSIMPTLAKTTELDTILAVKQEQTRATAEKELPARDPPGMPPEVVKILNDSRNAIKDVENQKTQRTIQLMTSYLKSLNMLAKNLLVRNELEKALEVKAEIGKIEFVLADAMSQVNTNQATPSQEVCRRCGGKGIIVTECYYCKGTGICSGCKGTGSVPKPGAKVKGSTFTHSLCKGTGKCPRCKGTGSSQEPCPACRVQ